MLFGLFQSEEQRKRSIEKQRSEAVQRIRELQFQDDVKKHGLSEAEMRNRSAPGKFEYGFYDAQKGIEARSTDIDYVAGYREGGGRK